MVAAERSLASYVCLPLCFVPTADILATKLESWGRSMKFVQAGKEKKKFCPEYARLMLQTGRSVGG